MRVGGPCAAGLRTRCSIQGRRGWIGPGELFGGGEAGATAGRRRGISGVRQPGGPRDPVSWRGRAGSGEWGGIDVLLSARRVSPGGRAYGLDTTDEMLELARENKRKAGVENVEFLKGEIEDIPLADDHVDVVISNCVINLSNAKERVIGEAFRVLKPGGRFAVSDMVFLGDKSKLPAEVVRSVELWAGCVSGAMERGVRGAAAGGGLRGRLCRSHAHVRCGGGGGSSCCGGSGCCGDAEVLREVPLASAFIRARKPAGR